MAREIQNPLLDLWIHADHLPASTIRALIEELNERRQGWITDPNDVVSFHPTPEESSELEHPLLELKRNR
jgi:hypothetical protein